MSALTRRDEAPVRCIQEVWPAGTSEAIGSQEHIKAVHAPHRAYEKTRLRRRSGRRSRVYLAE